MNKEKYKIIDISSLYKTSKDISNLKKIESITKSIFEYIESIVSYNMIVIYSIDIKKNRLKVLDSKGSAYQKLKDRNPFNIGEGVVGWVAKNKKALLIEDALESDSFKVRQHFKEDPVIRSFMAIPMITGSDLIGIISISSSHPKIYKKEDVELLSIISSQVAAILKLNIEINKTEKFSNHILEHINSGVIVINNNYEVIIFNSAAEKITNYSKEDFLKKSIFNTIFKTNDIGLSLISNIDDCIVYFEKKGYFIKKDGDYADIRLSTSNMMGDQNEKIGCICIFRDNTEIEKLQQKIIRSEKYALIGRITSGIAHEIRNPLLPIRAASQLLINKLENSIENKQINDLLKIINEESERLNNFLDEFLNLSKENIENNEYTNIVESIQETIKLIKPSCEKKGIEITEIYGNRDIFISISKNYSKQIFLNLFINAIDAIEETDRNLGHIHILCEEKNTFIRISIIDNGIGIKNADINKIFDPFYTTKDKGTGFGLSTVQKLLNSVGGDISINSIYNEGSEFIVNIPKKLRKY